MNDDDLHAQPAADANPKTCWRYCATRDGHICVKHCALGPMALAETGYGRPRAPTSADGANATKGKP